MPVEKTTGVFIFDKALSKKKLDISDDGNLIKSTFNLLRFSKLFSSKTEAKNLIFFFYNIFLIT